MTLMGTPRTLGLGGTRGAVELVLGGRRVPARSGALVDLVEPGTGEVLAAIHAGGAEDADVAVDLARAAFDTGPWPRTSAAERGRVLLRAAQRIREHGRELAELEVRNAGKTTRDARDDVESAADVFEYWGGAATKVLGETVPVKPPGLNVTLREPVGVCALICPWNFPLVIAAWKIAPALACGNTAIVKPALSTPLSTLLLADLLTEAGLPEGALSVVPGSGAEVGTALVKDPRVDKVSFTGSTEVGAEIARSCAANITRVSLELGGKSASIVFADADLDRVVESSAMAVFQHCGQNCCARSRLIVEAPVYRRFVEAFSERVGRMRVGDPASEGTDLGPLISAEHRDGVLGFLRAGLDDGARLVRGGGAPAGAPDGGAYLEPIILADVDSRMRVAREEVFGPLVSVIPFRGEDEAVALANDVEYGLSGSVWTRDLGRGIRMVKALRAGVLSVNSDWSVHTEAPFGGVKRSGYGREMGLQALELYTEVKNAFLSET